jgi:DNA-binding MarR family transcriptional regulator
MAQPDHRYIMSGLLAGWDWFDNSLQNLVRAAGFKPLNKSQSMMVLYVSAGITRPIDIARKMRLSRQAIRHISNQLIALGVLTAKDDPSDGRSKILSTSNRSAALRAHAHSSIRRLEALLRNRLGGEDYETLKRILSRDWGDVVSGPGTQSAKGTAGATAARPAAKVRPAAAPARRRR